MKRNLIGALLAAVAMTAAQPAAAYIARNRMLVEERPDGTIFVRPGPVTGNPDFWCAVGDYVLNFRNMPGDTRIFRMDEPPRRSGQGIRFSLSPEGAASRTGLAVITSGPPGSIMASTAFALCPRLLSRAQSGIFW